MSTVRPICVAIVALASLSGCSLFVVKGGRLHAEPSTSADLPFRNDGFYVSDGAALPCGRESEGLIDLEADSTQALAVVFTDAGEFLLSGSVEDIRTDAPPVRRGTYRVVGDGVDARTYIDGGDSGYRGYVTRYAITPTGPDSFVMDRVLDRPARWVRYNVYTERARVCIRQAFVFEAAHLGESVR